MDVKENRDLRLQMFVLGEKDCFIQFIEEPALKNQQPNIISLEAQTSDNTGSVSIQMLIYNNKQIIPVSRNRLMWCIIFRGVEAYLNYLEAYYLRFNNIDGWQGEVKRKVIGMQYAIFVGQALRAISRQPLTIPTYE